MHYNRLCAILILLLSYIATHAEEFTLKGSVRDRVTSSYIMMAKIECLNECDSVVGEAKAASYDYDYRRHVEVEKAVFSMQIPRVKGHYTLRLTHEEYDTITAPLDLTDIGRREFDREIGTFYMDRPKVHQLKDLEVTASKILFYNRGDTVVYNADAFQLAEGSMLDALIEQLPGVELRDGGQIYVNGKFVKSLLLNGKDFFKSDNRLMLDNLAAYTVKNIEVYKRQTDRARFLNLDDDDNKELVMDVKLKKEYIGGWTINSELAGGSEDRFLARLFAMNYRALSQVTLIGNANNLNDDSRPTAEDRWDPDKMTEGERRHYEVGIDYSMENDEASRKANGNLVVRSNRTFSDQLSNSITFLPGQNTYGTNSSNSTDREFDLSSRHELYMQTSIISARLTPMVTYNKGKSENSTGSVSSRDETYTNLINSTFNEAFGSSRRLSIGSGLSTTFKIPKTSDAIDLYGNFNYSKYNNHTESYYILKYGDQSMSPLGRHQYSDNTPTHSSEFNMGIAYNLVFNDKLNAKLKYEYESERNTDTSSFYYGQLDAGYTGDYTMANLYDIHMTYDPTNSNMSTLRNDKHSVAAGLYWQPNGHWDLSMSIPLCFYNNRLHLNQDNKYYEKDYRATLIDEFSTSIAYTKYNEDGGALSMDLGYEHNYRLPMLQNMITLPNTRDPLSLYLGNPDLKASAYNRYYITLQRSTRSNFMVYLYTYYQQVNDAITSSYSFDTQSGIRTYKTINVDGNWVCNSSLYSSWFWTKYNWQFIFNMTYTHYCTNNVIGTDDGQSQKVAMHNNNYNPRFAVAKYFGSGRSKYVSLSVEPSFVDSRSSDINANIINPFNGRFGLTGKYELPYGWSLSTSFNLHLRSGYHDPEMDKNELIWNSRISKSLMKGRLMLSFVAYDLLHQHVSNRYYITPQNRVETFTNTIPRYMLVDVQYRINIQPKKKIAQTIHHY